MNSGEIGRSEPAAPCARSISLKKRLLFLSVMFLAILAASELLAVLIYPLLMQRSYSRREVRAKLLAPLPDAGRAAYPQAKSIDLEKSHILHPYLGFTGNPGQSRLDWEFSRGNPDMRINEAGFLGESPLTRRSSDRLVVCLLGGSFAMNLYLDSRETLRRELGRQAAFRGKEITIICLAMSGYKQPQQVQALTYFLSLGAEYDVVINLDGFNEVALPFGENIPHGVYPYFPRAWNFYAARALNADRALQFARVVEQTQRRRKWRDTFAHSPLSFFNSGLIFWEAFDRRLDADIRRESAALQEGLNADHRGSGARDFETHGPALPEHSTRQDFLPGLADHWAACSRQMNRLAQAGQFAYFHFLQPSQYLKGSKPFSREEELRAFYRGGDGSEKFPFRTAVEAGYPLLLERGRDLARQGVLFTDLTTIFAERHETFYEDVFCHVNKAGNDVIAEKIAATLAQHHSAANRPP